MFPNYFNRLRGLALKQVTKKSLDVPNYQLGIYPYEVLTNVVRQGYVRTMPDISHTLVSRDQLDGQTYEGLSGWGSVVPVIETDGDVFFGDEIGGF